MIYSCGAFIYGEFRTCFDNFRDNRVNNNYYATARCALFIVSKFVYIKLSLNTTTTTKSLRRMSLICHARKALSGSKYMA